MLLGGQTISILFLQALLLNARVCNGKKGRHFVNQTRLRLHDLNLTRNAKDDNETAPIKAKDIEAHTFSQKVDHFTKSSTATFNQRYFQYTKCFVNKTGHMFLKLDGEWTADGSELITEDASGHKSMDDTVYLACRENFHALVLQLEHRYYGTSQVIDPTLRFLRVEQAIEDIAAFIRAKAAEFKVPFTRVVLFGCSYAGTVASYFRLTHPELCAGAISFSGPLQPTFDFGDYQTAVRKSMKVKYPSCYEKIDNLLRSGTISKAVTKSSNFGDISDKSLANLLNVANSNAATKDDSTVVLYQGFAFELFGVLAEMQYDDSDQKINISCAKMLRADSSSLTSMLAEFNNLNSVNFQARDAPAVSLTTKAPIAGGDEYFFTYQRCAQFGFFQSSTSHQRDWFPALKDGSDVLTADAEADAQCQSQYGIRLKSVKESVLATNRSFMDVNRVGKLANFLMVNGELDPWTLLARLGGDSTTAAKPSIKSIVVPGGFHCPSLNVGKRIQRNDTRAFIGSVAEQIAAWTK